MLIHSSKVKDILKENDICTDLCLKYVCLIDGWNYYQKLSLLNHFKISVQTKVVVKVCSLFVDLLRAITWMGLFSVNCESYDRDTFSRN